MFASKISHAAIALALCTAVAVPAAYAIDSLTPNSQATAAPVTEMQPALSPATIQVGSTCLPYMDAFGATTAPQTGAGLWLGSDSTTDGSWGYFIGHNPGPFCEVMGLEQGDLISICDRQGHQRAYQVVKAFRVTDDTCWEYIEDDVTGYGESAILQTCCGDNAHYRIVVCAAV